MTTETTISKNLQIADDRSKYDAACKCLLSEKIILAWIMKNCMEEYRNIDVNEIADKYIEGNPHVAEVPAAPDETNATPQIRGNSNEDKTMTEGTVTYDILFRAIAPVSGELIGLIINIEAQNNFYPGYPLIKRAIYYDCRMISAQYGTEFAEAHYEKIKKVHSVWICMNPPKYRENSVNRYRMTEDNIIGQVRENQSDYDLLAAIMICLGNANDTQNPDVLRLLNVLLSSETAPEEKKRILENDFAIEMTKTLEEELSLMCNLSQGVEEIGIQKGIERGLERGIKKGIEKGIEKGKLEALLSSIKNLMESMGWSADQAMNALKVPENEQARYADMIKQ